MHREESAVSEDFINAKVHGMRSRLFEGERLSALTDSRNLPELFRRIAPSAAGDGHLAFERDLLARQIRDLDGVGRFLRGPTFQVYQWLMVQYMVENLKRVLEARFGGGTRADAEALLAPAPRGMDLSLDLLFETPDMRKFGASIPVREFRDGVTRALKSEEHVDLFGVGMSLDRIYCERLLQLSADASERVQRLVGFDVDRRAALLLLRGKLNYGREFDDLRPYVVISRLYLSLRDAEAIHAASNIPDAIGRIPRRMLPEEARRSATTLQHLEDALLTQQCRLATRCFAQSVLDDAVAVAFFYVKRMESVNLVRVIEGVRHAMPSEEIEKALIPLSA